MIVCVYCTFQVGCQENREKPEITYTGGGGGGDTGGQGGGTPPPHFLPRGGGGQSPPTLLQYMHVIHNIIIV